MARLAAGILTIAVTLAVAGTARAETLTYTGAGQRTFVVPAGVTSLRVDAVGGAGGSGGCQPARNGGFGARVSTTLRVTPQTPLFVFVAANGADGRQDGINAVASLLGGGGAGGTSGPLGPCGGGAGGDASSVGLVGNAPPLGIGQTDAWLASRRVVAAGGGGGGGGFFGDGQGGDAGGPRGNGGRGSASNEGSGGQGGNVATQTAGGPATGGSPGYSVGLAGVLGQGGAGGSSSSQVSGHGAGGGGGGLFGGGGGGTHSPAGTGGGGGGAGSSFAQPDVTSATVIVTDATSGPSVTLTWTGPGGAPAPPGAGSSAGTGTGGTTVVTAKGRVVLNTFIDERPRSIVRARRSRATVTFGFSSNVGGARFRCKLDQRPSAPCRSGKSYTVSRGSHRFRVWAVVDGRSDSTPASFSFQLARRR